MTIASASNYAARYANRKDDKELPVAYADPIQARKENKPTVNGKPITKKTGL